MVLESHCPYCIVDDLGGIPTYWRTWICMLYVLIWSSLYLMIGDCTHAHPSIALVAKLNKVMKQGITRVCIWSWGITALQPLGLFWVSEGMWLNKGCQTSHRWRWLPKSLAANHNLQVFLKCVINSHLSLPPLSTCSTYPSYSNPADSWRRLKKYDSAWSTPRHGQMRSLSKCCNAAMTSTGDGGNTGEKAKVAAP